MASSGIPDREPRRGTSREQAVRRARTLRRWPGLVALAAVLLAVVMASGFGALSAQGPGEVRTASAAANTDRVLVKFRSNASDAAIAALNASMAVQQVDAIPALGVRVVRVPFGWTAEQVAERYGRNPMVEFAEPDALVEPELVPNDPEYQNAYGGAWHLPKIGAPEAWDRAKANGVLIAICDTGVATVPDLTPVLRGDLGWNTASNNSDWSPIAGHGTVVSGAAAAATNNGIGVAGVAWGAQIIPVRISNQTSGSAYVSDAAECITYAADRGARVANVSYRMASYSTIDSAAAYGRSRGMVTVVAAGNDGTNPGWPNHPNFLAVAATDKQDAPASWSNHGDFVDIAAPGVNIWTTKQDGTYWVSSGTSLSAPVVSGALALIFGAKPSLGAAEAEAVLLQTADDLGTPGTDPVYGHGRLNVARAVNAVAGGGGPAPDPTATPTPSPTATLPAPTPTPTVTASPTPTATATPRPGDLEPPTVTLTSPSASTNLKGNVTLGAEAHDNVAVARVEFIVDGNLVGSDSSAPYSAKWNASRAGKGTHTIIAVAYDAAGNAASDSMVVSVQ